MKTLLIGQAPGPNTDPLRPLDPLPKTGTGGRLAAIAGLSPIQYLRMFQRMNLLQSFPGRWKRDDKWPAREAEVAAAAIKPLLMGRRVILVGRNVSTAFGYPANTLDFHIWSIDELWGFEVAVVPHTSGRNHWYRQADNMSKAQEFWQNEIK